MSDRVMSLRMYQLQQLILLRCDSPRDASRASLLCDLWDLYWEEQA